MVQLTARNATAEDLVKVLKEQQVQKLDVVVPSRNLKARDGLIVVKNSEAVLGEDGVTTVNGVYRPTEVFDEGVSAKLEVPRQYLRKLREDRPDLYDANVNGWLHGRSRKLADGSTETVFEGDPRSFLLRLFRAEGGEGVARAFLSNKYALSMDHLDMLTAVFEGVQRSGQKVITRVTNLSERNMRVRFEAPEVYALAPELLEGYKSPFDTGAVKRAGSFDELKQQYGAHHMFSDKSQPLVYVGFDFTNSETGGGKYKLVPVVNVVRCTNGLVMPLEKGSQQGLERVHLGARLSEGEVTPSVETLRAAGKLVAEETADSVRAWLSKDYLEKLVRKLSEKAGVPVENSAETVPAVVARLGFTQEEQAGVLDLFVRSGQLTSGGVMQAVSAYAQTVEDPDRAAEVEAKAVEAMNLAAARS